MIGHAGIQPKARTRFDLRTRLWLVGTALALAVLALLARAAEVQVVERAFYQREANARFLRTLELRAARGIITDRNGEPLAVSTPVLSLAANPRILTEHPERLPELASAIGMATDALGNYVAARSGREFIYLPGQRRLNPAQAQHILERKIPGVFAQPEYRRFYPQGEVTAHVVGFTDVDDHGQEGMELALDAWLSGTPGVQRIIRDAQGRLVEHVELIRPAEPGRELALSLDHRIQYLAWRELNRVVAATKARSASAVVLDVTTGEVLAMVNLPSYNNNKVTGSAPDARRNRAVTDLIQPGSTVKPLTVAAALEAGAIGIDTHIDTNPGWIANGPYRTEDHRNYGVLNVTGVITKSSNVGAAKIVRHLPEQDFYQFLRRFGYGQNTGSGFPGEVAGVLPEPARWDGTTRQSLSYGYALSVTPLQMAQAYAAIGNGGRLIRPSFIKGGHNPGEDGVLQQALNPRVAREVLAMMRTTTEPGGTATRAAIAGYHVAGKTGTVRRASGGGYEERYTAFFAGLVPATRPRFAMAVVVDDPDPATGQYGGGVVSAPVFQRVMRETLRLLDVPPDDAQHLDGTLVRLDLPRTEHTRSAALPPGTRTQEFPVALGGSQ